MRLISSYQIIYFCQNTAFLHPFLHSAGNNVRSWIKIGKKTERSRERPLRRKCCKKKKPNASREREFILLHF